MVIDSVVAGLIVKLAYLATGLVVCFIGKGLLEKGISGKFFGEGGGASQSFRIATSSPGLVFLVAGLVIVVVGIRHDTGIDAQGSIRLARDVPVALAEPDASRDPIVGQARGLLARLHLVAAMGTSGKSATPATLTRARAALGRPDAPGAAAHALEELVAEDPGAAWALLQEPGHGWALEDEQVHLALSRAIDRRAREGIAGFAGTQESSTGPP